MQQTSVLDTLVYLFDYLVYEKKARPTVAEIHDELGAAGFAKNDIERAMKWLLDLNDLQEGGMVQAPSHEAIRVFSDAECDKISIDGRDCLLELSRLSVIDTRLREIIIQRLMTLDENDITAEEIKWVALMAVYNREGKEPSSVWLEQSLLENGDVNYAH